ncbi:MAG TPA: hypothetical protein PLK30_19115, partial [Blastocatellia bacterium]|nr:hypothetical protein [Blastocatellia bacterium]
MQTPPPNKDNQFLETDKLAGQTETTVLPINYTGGMVAPSPYFPHEMKAEEEAGFDIRDFMHRIQRRKWLILTIVTIVTVMAAVSSSRQKSIFVASATVEIGTNKNQMLLKDGDFFYVDDSQELETAAFLIKSYPLLELAAAKLELDQNKSFLDVTQERSILDVIKNKGTKKTDEASAENSGSPVAISDDSLELPKLSQEESQRLAPLVGILSSGLTVEKVKLTRLIRISYKHTNPKIAAFVANGIAETFINYNYKRKNRSTDDASTALNQATRELESQTQRAEQELANYTRANGIFSLEGKVDLTT